MDSKLFLERLSKSISSWKPDIPTRTGARYCKETGLDLPGTFKQNLEKLEGEDRVFIDPSLRVSIERIKGLTVPGEKILWEHEPTNSPERAKFGVAKAMALVADTGTVVLKPQTRNASWASLLAEQVFIFSSRETIFPDLASFFSSKPAKDPPFLLVTGASRTADIEKELVIPAHGPSRLFVFITPEEADMRVLKSMMEKK